MNSEDGTAAVIRRIGPEEEYRTLGVFISASGRYGMQVIKMRRQACEWAANIRASSLNSDEKLIALNQYLLPQLGYPLPCITVNNKELEKLQTTINNTV